MSEKPTGMAFWAIVAEAKSRKTQQSETRNFINKVRNIPALNKRREFCL
jgi:hypothetical protein